MHFNSQHMRWGLYIDWLIPPRPCRDMNSMLHQFKCVMSLFYLSYIWHDQADCWITVDFSVLMRMVAFWGCLPTEYYWSIPHVVEQRNGFHGCGGKKMFMARLIFNKHKAANAHFNNCIHCCLLISWRSSRVIGLIGRVTLKEGVGLW